MKGVAYSKGCVLIKCLMKQYVIDGLRLEDHHKLKEYLDQHTEPAPLGGIYWMPLPEDILTPEQAAHTDCRPHVFGLMLEETQLAAELLVRIKKNIKCDCMAYADKTQRDWLIDQTDAILEQLAIRV